MNKSRFRLFDALENTAFGRLNLRSKLTLSNMLITFFVILSLGAYVYYRTQQAGTQLTSQLEGNIRNRVEESLSSTSNEQAALLNSFFTALSSDTAVIGSTVKDILDKRSSLDSGMYWDASTSLTLLESGSWDNPNTEAASIFIPSTATMNQTLIRKLNTLKHTELMIPSFLKDNPDIVAIYFGGTLKETIYYPNIDLANIVPPDFDVTGRVWYVDASPENNPDGNVVWSTPYQDAALNGLVITTSVPVFDAQNRFQGVAAMDVQLNQITNVVSNIRVGETGYAFLIDSNNRLMALPQEGYADFGIIDETAQLGEIMDTTTLPAASPEFFEMLTRIASTEGGVFNIPLGGSERFVAFQQIPEVNYKLVLIVPSSEMLTETAIVSSQIQQETRNTIAISLLLIAGIFVLASITSLAIGNRLTTPLQSLTRVANEIIAGNFDAKAEVETQDEIGTLSTTLNTMTSNIKDLVQSLEQRVEERTAALQESLQKNERRGKQYEAIAKVSQAINATQNLTELLPQISQVISQQFGLYHVGIFLNDAGSQYAVLGAANSDGGKKMLKRGHQLKIGEQGIVGYVTGTGRPRIALDVGVDAVFFNNPDLPETRSEMALPLVIAGQIIGALDVQSTESNAFTNEDIEVLSTLAEQVSIAIQNARLYEQTQKSLAEAEAVSRQYFTDTWKSLSQESKIAGYRYTPAGTIAIEEDSLPELVHTDRRSITVPIIIRGQTVGELAVLVPKQEHIKADQMDLIHAVADRVGIFAENARLFDETSRRAEREHLVSDITAKIRSTNDPREMLETAIKELRHALNVDRIEVIPQKVTSPDK
ncbi:MAG: GAF domain-containing protein [Anaerolineales bacterium]|nr:GAF domain-containing protein [Anaerolineales bacterium]